MKSKFKAGELVVNPLTNIPCKVEKVYWDSGAEKYRVVIPGLTAPESEFRLASEFEKSVYKETQSKMSILKEIEQELKK